MRTMSPRQLNRLLNGFYLMRQAMEKTLCHNLNDVQWLTCLLLQSIVVSGLGVESSLLERYRLLLRGNVNLTLLYIQKGFRDCIVDYSESWLKEFIGSLLLFKYPAIGISTIVTHKFG